MAKKSGRRPRIDRESPEFQQRVKGFREARSRGNRDRAKKNFAERMLGSYGLGEEHFKKNGFVKGKLGLFAEAMKNEHQNEDKAKHQVPPEMELAKIERDKRNPNISTIIDQFHSIIKTANRVGVITAAQQSDLQTQISQYERHAKEQSMEAGGTSRVPNVSGTNLEPLNDELGTLIQKIKPFEKAIDEKIKEEEENKPRGFMQRFAESYGVGDEYETYTKRKAARASRVRTNPGFRRVLGSNGRVTYRGPGGRFASSAEAIAQATPSRLARATGSVRNAGAGLLNMAKRATGSVGRVASKVGGARLASGAGSLSKRVAAVVGKGVKGASVAASASRNVSAGVIKRIVKPIITKAIGSTVLKSIPIIGAAVGGLFAAKKLLEGDPVGAGLEAASGLAGPVTAIPAMAASVSRDAYSSVFDVQPEQDPLFSSRMKMITGIVGGMITAMLASKIEKKETPTQSEIDRATVPSTPPAQPQAGETATGAPAIPRAPTPPPATTPSPTSSSTPTPTPTPQASGRSGGTGSSTPTPTSPPSAGSGDAGEMQPSPTPSMVPNTPTTGAELTKMTAEVEAAASKPIIASVDAGQRPLPATTPTTRSGVSGAGNVPDPNYYGMGMDIASQVYFNYNAVTSA